MGSKEKRRTCGTCESCKRQSPVVMGILAHHPCAGASMLARPFPARPCPLPTESPVTAAVYSFIDILQTSH